MALKLSTLALEAVAPVVVVDGVEDSHSRSAGTRKSSVLSHAAVRHADRARRAAIRRKITAGIGSTVLAKLTGLREMSSSLHVHPMDQISTVMPQTPVERLDSC